jgi:hypothetical protein
MTKKLEEKRSLEGRETPIGIACTKSIEVLTKYYNFLGAHSHLAVATICDLRFNVGVFNKVLPSSTNNAKRAKLRTNFKEVFH